MTNKRKKNKSANEYVNNAKFLESIIQYKKDCAEAEAEGRDKPRIPEYCGQCLLMIGTNLSHSWNFCNYSFREEMIGDGLINATNYFDNFDPEKTSNPFAYFTQIFYYAFLRRIELERKQTYVKHKVTVNSMIYDDLLIGDTSKTHVPASADIDTDYISDFVTDYESNMEKKRQRAKEARDKKKREENEQE